MAESSDDAESMTCGCLLFLLGPAIIFFSAITGDSDLYEMEIGVSAVIYLLIGLGLIYAVFARFTVRTFLFITTVSGFFLHRYMLNQVDNLLAIGGQALIFGSLGILFSLQLTEARKRNKVGASLLEVTGKLLLDFVLIAGFIWLIILALFFVTYHTSALSFSLSEYYYGFGNNHPTDINLTGSLAYTLSVLLPGIVAVIGCLLFLLIAEKIIEFLTGITPPEKPKTEPVNITEHVYQTLLAQPETSFNELKKLHPGLSKEACETIARRVFLTFLNEEEFINAKHLLNYHPVDTIDLLHISQSLAAYEAEDSLELTPRVFKIKLDDGETAYEKIACNWQKIHTYLAPLKDEVEQADILDTGNTYITDQRILFVGEKGSVTVRFADITFLDHKEDALQFFRDEGLSEIFAFPTIHHAAYTKLVIESLLARA